MTMDENKPIIDPTANVLALVKTAVERLDDLRTADKERVDDLLSQQQHYMDKLATERLRSEAEAKAAEARRIDALLAANTNNVALALEKQGAQAQAQDKRIAALEQNQYQGVGATGQRLEGRQSSQWVIGTVIGAIIGIVLILLRFTGH